MENITIGEISILVAFLVALITGVKFLLNEMKKVFETVLKPTNDKIDDLNKKVDKVDKNATMNYLVRCIDDIDRGNGLDKTARKRFIEQYEHYIKDLNGNTYIKEEFERIKRGGKL